jgi:hypothetical protein
MIYYMDTNNKLWDEEGNTGFVNDTDPLYQAYVEHLKADGKGAECITVKSAEEEIQEINEWYETQALSLVRDVPRTEQDTWTLQKIEAEAYVKDFNVKTPFIDQIITRRKETLLTKVSSEDEIKPYLVEKILYKATLFTQAVGTLIGERQRLVDLIEAKYIHQNKRSEYGF